MPESPSSTTGSPASIQAPPARWARVAGGQQGFEVGAQETGGLVELGHAHLPAADPFGQRRAHGLDLVDLRGQLGQPGARSARGRSRWPAA